MRKEIVVDAALQRALELSFQFRLIREEISDYELGRLDGKIDALTWVMEVTDHD